MLVYVTRPKTEVFRQDPVGERFAAHERYMVEVAGGETDDEILSAICALINEAREAGEQDIAVIFDAFIGVPGELFQGAHTWIPDRHDLDKLLIIDKDRRNRDGSSLLSLRLLWRLWAKAGNEVHLLVTLDGVSVSPVVRLAFAQAFGDGRICHLYSWNLSTRQAERLVELCRAA